MLESSRIDWLSRHGDRSNISQDEIRELAEELWAWRHLNELHKVFEERGVTPKPTFEEVFPHLKGSTTGQPEQHGSWLDIANAWREI